MDDEERITLIDFPQMVSVGHPNAQELFERDVECIVRFFRRGCGLVLRGLAAGAGRLLEWRHQDRAHT